MFLYFGLHSENEYKKEIHIGEQKIGRWKHMQLLEGIVVTLEHQEGQCQSQFQNQARLRFRWYIASFDIEHSLVTI